MFSSLRTRILVWYVGLLAVATIATVVVARQVVHLRLDDRINEELVQETRELRRLAGGTDPSTGEPFGSNARRIFRVFLERNIPARYEAFLTFVDGEQFLRSRPADASFRIDQDPELTARWSTLTTAQRGSAPTPAGTLQYLAIPLEVGARPLGVFVVAIFTEPEERELDSALLAVAAVGAMMLLVGSILAWRLAGSLLGPVKTVTQTAQSISESDLSKRIPVEGRDEIAGLAATFNDMLDRLEHAFRTQRRFVDDAGHELRTPITIVRGHLELLEDDPEERRETIVLVTDELDRMTRIVTELLELAKAEQPDFLAPESIDLATFTSEVHAKASALAPGDWRLERSAEGVVTADRQRLTQALVQLAQNAVQHGAAGQPIGLGSALEGRNVRFWVRDRGPGIPVEEQRRVFERFARGGGERRSDGAGLGLAIVKAIAEAHGGRVELDSRPGAGATFSIIIPLVPKVAVGPRPA